MDALKKGAVTVAVIVAAALAAYFLPLAQWAIGLADRARLDQVVADLSSPAARDEATWTREQRLAFWINAYDILTLRAIVDHYPIRSGWLTLAPRNSIRQIDGRLAEAHVAGRRQDGHTGRH